MNPEPSISRTWRGAADGASAVAGRSARVVETSFIAVSRAASHGCADLARRRAFAFALAAGSMRRLRNDTNLPGDPAGRCHRPVDIAARAVRALDPAKRRQIEVHAGMPERPA